MQPDNSTNSLNSTPAVNSDITVNCTTPTNADDLFDNEQTAIEATAITNTIEPPKQQRIGKQQRKSDFAEFKATFLVPAKLVKRHALNIEGDLWNQLSAFPESSATVVPRSAVTPTPSSPSI